MLRHVLDLLAGLVLMLLLFEGLFRVADTQGVLDDDVARSGPPLTSVFSPAEDPDAAILASLIEAELAGAG
jgi:spore maturation protein SpmA